jgi:hypothetical protein
MLFPDLRSAKKQIMVAPNREAQNTSKVRFE